MYKYGLLAGAVMLVMYGCGGGGGGSSFSDSDAQPVEVATGLLDTDFNTVGYNTFDVANSHDSATSVVAADDDSIYLAGYAADATGTGYDVALWHVLEDGTADTGFDGDGLAILAGAAGGSGGDYAEGVAIDGNGKIIIVGHSTTAGGDKDIVVARYLSDGTLDTTFGGDVNPLDGTPDGFVVVDTSGAGSADESADLVIDSSGSIYVAGHTDAAGDNDFTVWKFTSSGALDTSFAGGSGYLSYDSGVGTSDDRAKDIVIDANGKIVVTGRAGYAADVGDLFIWRVTSNGVSDTSFSGTGFVIEGDAIEGSGIAIDDEGNIVVTGHKAVTGNLTDMTLWRYTTAGVLDTTFGSPNGYITHDGAGINNANDYDYGYDVVVDDAGNYLVSGASYADHSGLVRLDMVVWRFTSDGTLDDTFGDDVNPADGTPDGFFTHHGAAGDNNADKGKAIALDSTASIVVGGESVSAANGSDMAVWRLY